MNDRQDILRRLPAVHQLVASPALASWVSRLPHDVVADTARAVLGETRDSLQDGRGSEAEIDVESLAAEVEQRLSARLRSPLVAVINATGIIVHTGLGRAPLPARACAALADISGGYTNLELDLATGQRGKRSHLVRPLLCELTGAESATVVNNNAGALVIALTTVADPARRSVIVSRGQLIEIGGSFRLPEVMESGGVQLREVGTTNRTRIEDYAQAIDDQTAALLQVHTSNYRVEGFTESASTAELAALGHARQIPLIADIGSGLLVPSARPAMAGEPDARTAIARGADLVLFSGDKLLGGPQAGIIVGRSQWIDRIESNPLMRSLRVGKLTLAALSATLDLHRHAADTEAAIPVLSLAAASPAELRARAGRLAERIAALSTARSVEVIDSTNYLGGGSMPEQAIEGVALRIIPREMSEDQLAHRLRGGEAPVVPCVRQGAVCIEMRTVFREQDESLSRALEQALSAS
ncbi:MAG: L-seryl-tRNA(Sec) selenium transferase [Phycisphaerae bacterium]|nr:L-seryl-tRNA(Sec) selenium transferase [Phycisphaerae bacterium]